MASAPDKPPRRRRRWTRWLVGLGAFVLIFWLLIVSGSPTVPPNSGPTPELAEAGRQVLANTWRTQRRGRNATPLRLDARQVSGLAVLAGDAAGIRRTRASIEGDRLVAEASLRLPLGQWINSSVSFSGRHSGFPDLELRIGHLPLPSWVTRASIEVGRWMIRLGGVDVPPLDELVRGVSVADGRVEADLRLPGRGMLAEAVSRLRGGSVDEGAIRLVYCRIAAARRDQADLDLPALVRIAFAEPDKADAGRNRASLVALAMAAAGRRSDNLAPAAAAARRSCGSVGEPVLLGGRADLAKHWALSAALTAVLGADAAGSMGEWKELSDSRPSGSGFSFVDLAADRSGMHAARRAVDPDTAREAALRLSNASEQSLLPLRLLAAQEGLSEQEFVERYRSIDSARYQQTVARIDRELARSGLLGAGP